MVKLAVIVGTRPEAIKLAPLIVGARQRTNEFHTTVVSTGQHKEMLSQVLNRFDIVPDIDLDIMQANQNLADLTTAAMSRLYPTLKEVSPDWVIVQGDTTTTMTGALAAYYNQLRVAHIEAGLRTDDKHQPFPEEGNRRLTTHIADLHFAPTGRARSNLLREGIADNRILVTGNTSIDALLLTLDLLQPADSGHDRKRQILLTVHRRENHGQPLRRIFTAVRQLADSIDDLEFLYPVHPNPEVRGTAIELLSGHSRIRLTDPLGYDEFVLAMQQSHLVLTDSGGIQEEAPTLNRPVLVLREKTERQEGVEAGTLKLIGTDTDTIISETRHLLEDREAYQRMADAKNPFGDGRAAERILDRLAGVPNSNEPN